MTALSFAGESFEPSPAGTLYWGAQDSLLVADLHLEKASWFASAGQMLPPYDSHATLEALASEAKRTGARRLYCLGDSFHDRFGCDRLPAAARVLLESLTERLDWTWIIGNHDSMTQPRRPGDDAGPSFADHCGGRIVEEAEVAGILLRHEARPDEPRPEISGHFHPKLRVNVNGRSISRRCFVASERKLILPAFGTLTGGLDASHPAIARATSGNAVALVPVADRLLRFPIAA
ncbi:MAG TPA: ligase-associated DNA damage response endonuclease PdeM [Sphingomicrobium sp.]|nr:ligase-associated DNA damage response endonuclease PdeM [Sphingomicrobium sp.]